MRISSGGNVFHVRPSTYLDRAIHFEIDEGGSRRSSVHLTAEQAKTLRDQLNEFLGTEDEWAQAKDAAHRDGAVYDGCIILSSDLSGGWSRKQVLEVDRGVRSNSLNVLMSRLYRLMGEAQQQELSDGWYLVEYNGVDVMRYRRAGRWHHTADPHSATYTGPYDNIRKATVQS